MLTKKIVASSLLLGILFLPVFTFATNLDRWKDSLDLSLQPQLHALVCLKIGRSLRRENPSSAHDFLSEGLEYVQGTGINPLVVDLLNCSGQTARYQGNYQQAVDLHERALAYETDSLHRKVSGYTYLNLSLAYKGLGLSAIAIPYQKSALLAYRETGDQKMIANCYNNLGNIYRQMGDYSRALAAQKQAMEIRYENDDFKGLSYSYHNLGFLYQTMGVMDESERYYDQAICLKDSLGGTTQIGPTYLNLGELFYERGDYDSARKFAGKALRRALLNEDKATVAEAYSNISWAYMAEGKLTLAESAIKKAIRLTQANQQVGYAKIIGRYGLWFVESGQTEVGIDSLNRSLMILRSLQSPKELQDAYDRLKTAYLSIGETDKALYWSKHLDKLKDSLFQIQLNAHLEAHEIQGDLASIQLENLQLQETLEKERLGYLWVGNALVAAFLLAIGVVLSYRNRRQTEINQLLNGQNEKIAQANFDLRHANHEMEQVIHVLSHELKTPVRNVGGYVSLLRRRYLSQLDADGQEFLNYAMEGVKSINQLLSDLLQYAQLGSKQSPVSGKVPIEQVIARATQELMPQIEAYGAQLEIAPLPDLDVNYRAFYLVFRHLLDNALKFRKAGRALVIKIGYRSEPGRHLFWLSDNGIGIEAEYQEQIFNLFQRLNPHEETSGTGLGLAACRKIVRNYKGEIWVESFIDEGTTIFINLPDPTWRKNITFGPYSGERFIAGTNM
ncbi:MAG: tetratricopeptide repeat protein [Bacteroidia bacterium]